MMKLGTMSASRRAHGSWVVGVVGALGALVPSAAGAQTSADSAAIVETALDYIQGWYTGDAERMARALHPDLVKRIVVEADGHLMETTGEQLIESTDRGGGSGTPAERRQDDVTILDIFRNAASVKVVAADWIDYLHIAKVDGRWVILNVLWEVKGE